MTLGRIQFNRCFNGMKFVVTLALVVLVVPAATAAQNANIKVLSDASGSKLQVDGEDFMVLGMNWGYIPIGQNYSYSLWAQPDDVVIAALEREMTLLKTMGVNTIRQYVGITPRWVQYIYERYGIYTILNHALGRYGVTVDGVWIPSTDYSDPRTREVILAEIEAAAKEFRDTPGVLMWLLGNENNYGLVWKGAETEDLPEEEANVVRARYLYSLFGEATQLIKSIEPERLVAMANGDLGYIDIIAQEVKGLDIFGSNVYRGISFGNLFQEVKDKLNLPLMFTEFGADAWNARDMREDQVTQARYFLGQWQEIYEQSAGKGLNGNAIGGLSFQWSDGWWKYLQEENLDVHDINASWANGGYPEDFRSGDNNMNEEWWGICAKGPPDSRGMFELYPRAAYYGLQQAYKLEPYAASTSLEAIRAHFAAIHPGAAALMARGDNAYRVASALERVRVSDVQMEFETYSTGGDRISTPPSEDPQNELPAFLGFDHQQSFYTAIEAKPAGNVTANVTVNILGNVGVNRIDEIFYESRGRRQTVEIDGEPVALEDLERVKVYNASVMWDDRWFKLQGFYRTGHTHWGYEGDFFGMYRDAYYGENLNIYNGIAPVGAELALKRNLEGLMLAFGPELYWGGNPSFLAKYQRTFGSVEATAIYQNEFQQRLNSVSSIAVPRPATKRASLALESTVGPFGVTLGGLWAGEALVDRPFQIIEETGDSVRVLVDTVRNEDTFGGKVKLTWEKGRWHWYGQYAYAGIVANGGPDATITYTGWALKDHGGGNGNLVSTGLAANVGTFQISPNFLWQKPLVGPIPGDVPAPGRPRNQIDDPFAVRGNREMTAVELVITHDPTPATWMWTWDNDVREDAHLAWSLGLTYRHFPTTMDAAIGILEDGRTFFAFPGATPPRDLWDLRLRMVSKASHSSRIVAHLFAGTGEPNGDDTRLVHRFGGDARIAVGTWAFETFAKFGDWGPYDYHRDGNLTFPVHLMADVSYSLGKPSWFGLPQTKIGIRGVWRSLDQNSNRYCPATTVNPAGEVECDPIPGAPSGNEWEIRTYLHVSVGT